VGLFFGACRVAATPDEGRLADPAQKQLTSRQPPALFPGPFVHLPAYGILPAPRSFMSLSTLVVIVVFALLVFWAVGAYNRLVRLKNIIANAFGQIDVQLKRRYDLIPNLVEAAKKYLQHEQSTLEAVTLARNQARSASDAVRSRPANAGAVTALAVAEQALEGSLGRLFAVAEAYPELKADQTIRELSEELTSTENKVGFARQAYNDAVLDYNNAQGQFPAVLIARTFGFAPSAMLRATENATERQAVRIQM
jgi:LemA protein